MNRTVVFTSKDGKTWKPQGWFTFRFPDWRATAVAFGDAGDGIAIGLGFSNSILLGKLGSSGYVFDDVAYPAPTDTGWSNLPPKGQNPPNLGANADPTGQSTWLVYTNITASTVIGRVPGSKRYVLLAYPTDLVVSPGVGGGPKGNEVKGAKPQVTTHGYSFYVFDTQTKTFTQNLPIGPSPTNRDPAEADFVMHLTVLDPARQATDDGPIMLYWYDVDGASKTAVIRGRVIKGMTPAGDLDTSDDLPLNGRKPDGSPIPFSVLGSTGGTGHWYGDYKGGSAYLDSSNARFFPMWVQNDSAAHWTEVVVHTKFALSQRRGTAPTKFVLAVQKKVVAQPVALTDHWWDSEWARKAGELHERQQTQRARRQ